MTKQETKNKYFFGLGTVGRDMFYAFEANALLYFLSNIMTLPKATFAMVSVVLTVLRILDALNDPITGLIIDNSHSKYGKFKPPILFGALASVVFYLIMFSDFGLTNYWYAIIFGVAYIAWDISYGINDIAYWSMMPSLTLDQKKRESYGAFARICANIGMYIIMVGWQPITTALGNTTKAWFIVAVAVSILMIAFQMFTIFGVKEDKNKFKQESKTTLKELFHVLFANDQLMWTALAMALFMVGYCTTTGFAAYYMQYLYGDINMYAVLAGVCGIAQLAALIVFPYFSKRHTRKQLYTVSTILVIVGYFIFFFAESSLYLIAGAAVVIFVGQAFIQLLMLMFLADTIEYGQWKLHKRNDSITFSIQPLINKIGAALSTGVISMTLIISGIKSGDVAATSIDAAGQMVVKISMFVIPLVFIVAGYLIYLTKFKLDEKCYAQIVKDLEDRGEIKANS